MPHPFKEFYPVWNAQQLLDWAYNKATKKSAGISTTMPKIKKIKIKEINRINSASKLLMSRIEKTVKSVPNLDELPLFYRQLSDLLVDNDLLKKNLGRINGVIPVIKKLVRSYQSIISKQTSFKECGRLRVEFFGRVSSIIRQLNDAFEYLDNTHKNLQKIPILNLQMPSVVVAGYPNVGKSTLVGKLSTAQPTISSYPFTTKQIFIGMYRDELGSEYFQVIDTPGILDRPMKQRNDIEKQAILALNTIASIVLFVFDPTFTSGYDVDSQIELYNEIKEEFLKDLIIPIKIVINKIDFAQEEEISYVLNKLNIEKSDVILVSAKDGMNVDSVIDSLLKHFKNTNFRR